MTELHVEQDGRADGPVVVFVGSLGSTTAMWAPQVTTLGARARCLLVDLPGHGASATAPGPFSIAGLADDVAATLERAGVDRAHIVGLSIGAMIAMQLAIAHPERVDRTALLCTAAWLGPADAWTDRAALVRAEGTRAVADTVVGRWLTPDHAAAHADEVAAFVEMISSVDDEGYAGCCEAIAAMDLRPELAAIDAPTLVIAGALDPATPVEHGELIAAEIPDARMAIVEGAHLASWECARDVNARLTEHLLERRS